MVPEMDEKDQWLWAATQHGRLFSMFDVSVRARASILNYVMHGKFLASVDEDSSRTLPRVP